MPFVENSNQIFPGDNYLWSLYIQSYWADGKRGKLYWFVAEKNSKLLKTFM